MGLFYCTVLTNDRCALTCSYDRYVWVLEGDTGKVLKGWPVKLPSEVRATVLVTKLIPGENGASDVVSTNDRANLVPRTLARSKGVRSLGTRLMAERNNSWTCA